MLYIENWKAGKKGSYTVIAFLLVLLLLTGCKSTNGHQDKDINMEAFSDMKTPAFIFDNHKAAKCLKKLALTEKGSAIADKRTCSYYLNDSNPLVWIDRYGVDERADSLLAWLHLLHEIGLSERAFDVDEIEQDLKRVRTLDFQDEKDDYTQVAARLEFRLTKACLRYCYGMRFGFVNPHNLLNNLDIEKTDTLKNIIKYFQLFDVKMDLPPKNYASAILKKVRTDSIAAYLRYIQPKDKFYHQLRSMLQNASAVEKRKLILINMERSRWRIHEPIADTGKRIIVNIPAYHLYAFSESEVLDMRVVCGNVKTKTPQLTSNIEWMEVNPKWNIPFSIIEKDIARKAGDTAYFSRNRYRIYDKVTNKEMNVSRVTAPMLLSGDYRVAQDGGAGNSLGRIIFRFKNNFSVFLHDTSNPGAFERSSRAMSHGCVRVSKPFELARFVLEDPDEWLLDRIRIAMGLPAESPEGLAYEQEHPEEEVRNNLISYIPVKPHIPIYIIYYTLWPDVDGEVKSWPDVYGFDEVLWNQLKAYI